MSSIKTLLSFLIVVVSFQFTYGQDSTCISILWDSLSPGIYYSEVEAPQKSITNDSKLSIVKINPNKVEFALLSASEHGNKSRTAPEWAKEFNMNVIVNAGMYDLNKTLSNKGFMQNFNHMNNPTLYPSYGGMIAFNRADSTLNNFEILDLEHTPWDSVKTCYYSYSQGMRMIDCNGSPLTWNKKNQLCSMLLCAIDKEGFVYYVFCRSPYTHNEMIGFLLAMPFEITGAIYLEGGPETSMYISTPNKKVEKFGSYVSRTYENDNNDHFWKIPNVIGVRAK
ncbi:MAG: phosphodiester glycosidase family protein [Flavobacteriales bacterium]